MAEQQAHARAERRHLRQRKVHKDDLAPHDVQPQINQDSRQSTGRAGIVQGESELYVLMLIPLWQTEGLCGFPRKSPFRIVLVGIVLAVTG